MLVLGWQGLGFSNDVRSNWKRVEEGKGKRKVRAPSQWKSTSYTLRIILHGRQLLHNPCSPFANGNRIQVPKRAIFNVPTQPLPKLQITQALARGWNWEAVPTIWQAQPIGGQQVCWYGARLHEEHDQSERRQVSSSRNEFLATFLHHPTHVVRCNNSRRNTVDGEIGASDGTNSIGSVGKDPMNHSENVCFIQYDGFQNRPIAEVDSRRCSSSSLTDT